MNIISAQTDKWGIFVLGPEKALTPAINSQFDCLSSCLEGLKIAVIASLAVGDRWLHRRRLVT